MRQSIEDWYKPKNIDQSITKKLENSERIKQAKRETRLKDLNKSLKKLASYRESWSSSRVKQEQFSSISVKRAEEGKIQGENKPFFDKEKNFSEKNSISFNNFAKFISKTQIIEPRNIPKMPRKCQESSEFITIRRQNQTGEEGDNIMSLYSKEKYLRGGDSDGGRSKKLSPNRRQRMLSSKKNNFMAQSYRSPTAFLSKNPKNARKNYLSNSSENQTKYFFASFFDQKKKIDMERYKEEKETTKKLKRREKSLKSKIKFGQFKSFLNELKEQRKVKGYEKFFNSSKKKKFKSKSSRTAGVAGRNGHNFRKSNTRMEKKFLNMRKSEENVISKYRVAGLGEARDNKNITLDSIVEDQGYLSKIKKEISDIKNEIIMRRKKRERREMVLKSILH